MKDYAVQFIMDDDVDDVLDHKLMKLLSISFPDQQIFKVQRFYKEKPGYRWFIMNGEDVIAHVAVHKKEIKVKNSFFTIGGIAEVCVHPDYRGKGIVKLLLTYANNLSKKNKFIFSMLFGDANVYSSSGYKTIKNKIKYLDHESKLWKVEEIKDAMVKSIADYEWPNELIDIQGPTF